MFDLKELRKKREEILKAELFMLLHDVGKLQPGHQAKFIRGYSPPHWATRYKHDKHILDHPLWEEVNLINEGFVVESREVLLKDVISKHHDAVEKSDDLWLVFTLRIDRLDSEYDREHIIAIFVQPLKEFIEIDSAFGIIRRAYKRIDSPPEKCESDQKVWPLYYAGLSNFTLQQSDCLEKAFSQFLKRFDLNIKNVSVYFKNRQVSRLFMQIACGDTRFTVNDVTLWDHSISTAILYKSLIAWAIAIEPNLSSTRDFPRGNDERFRKWFHPQLLPLRIDGLSYLSDSINIPDLLARKQTLTKAYDTLRNILEWEFPIAGEVYRDENGPVFLTFLKDQKGEENISLSDLNLPDENGSAVVSEVYEKGIGLDEYLRRAMSWKTLGDLTLPSKLKLFTYTQKPSDDSGEKSLGDILKEENEKGRWYQPDIDKIQNAWDEVRKRIEESNCRHKKEHHVEEVCSVCGLRPQGYGAWLVEKIRDDENSENKEEEARKLLDDWENYYKYCENPERQKEKDGQTFKAISRRMCGVCLNRREKRAEKWAQGIELSSEERFLKGHPETVWLDEVADKNGRIALIVGYFPLENWLDGSLVESLAMFKRDKCCENNTECQGTSHKWVEISGIKVCLGPKPVSYSRIRRVWETTRRFWQDVAPTDAPPEELQDLLQNKEFSLSLKDLWEGPLSLENSLAGKIVGKAGPRLEIKGIPKEIIQNRKLGKYHAYELILPNNVKIAVLWDPTNEKLITLENLVYTARNLGWNLPRQRENESKEEYEKRLQEEAAEFVKNNLQGKTVSLNIPPEYGLKSETVTTFKIKATKIPNSFYTPLIPILAEPQVFMAIVPANKAFEVVKAIKTKYEREMGKVRNRLPLHIGVVYVYRKMPLRAILDAGRRMLKQNWGGNIWEVTEKEDITTFGKELKTEKNLSEDDLEKEYKELFKNADGEKITSQFAKWHRIVLKQETRIKVNNDEDNESREPKFQFLIWYVPAVMGDGQTEDQWYPYVFWQQDKDGNTDPANANREINRYYKAINPWNSNHPWLVHVGELKPGDKIYFTPATFDFEFLDTNARRFEIAYDDDGKRRNSLTKPYLLDEIEVLDKIWKFLTQKDDGKPRLSTTQIFALRETIETKREEWFENMNESLIDENFKKFCHDLFANAQWQWGKPGKKELQWLADMAVRGYFTDAVYLFHHVMKEKVEDHTEAR